MMKSSRESLPHYPRMALRFLPREKRRDVLTIWNYYLFIHDELAGAFNLGGTNLQNKTMELQTAIRNQPAHRKNLFAMIDGWNIYFLRQRHRDWRQVETMIGMIAAAPARAISASLANQNAAEPAAALGKAIALLELIRCLPLHLDSGRLPFAETELEQFRVPAQDIVDRRITAQFQDLMWYQTKRIRELLTVTEAHLHAFPDDGSRRFVKALIEWQRILLEKIEQSGFDVYSQHFELNRLESFKAFVAHRRIVLS